MDNEIKINFIFYLLKSIIFHSFLYYLTQLLQLLSLRLRTHLLQHRQRTHPPFLPLLLLCCLVHFLQQRLYLRHVLVRIQGLLDAFLAEELLFDRNVIADVVGFLDLLHLQVFTSDVDFHFEILCL